MIPSISISSPGKQRDRGFGSEVGSGQRCTGGLMKVNVNLESLFLFDSDVNDRPVQLAHLCCLPPTSTWTTYGHNEVSSFNFIA